MRTLLLAALALVLLVGRAGIAHAGFFDPCLVPGDGTITVTQNTVVANRRVTLPADQSQRSCDIEVADGVSLTLVNVTVNVANDKRLNFSGGDTSSLSIVNTSVNACDNDIFGFKQVTITNSRLVDPQDGECDVKEFYVTGNVTISKSLLTAQPPEADSDIVISSENGSVTLAHDTLIANDDIKIQAPGGGVSVTRSRLSAQGNIDISGAGRVEVVGNELQAAGSNTISGNPCRSLFNRPHVSCS
jgi:hypothetical protein